MSDRLYVGTRKGLFTWERNSGGSWQIARRAFVGDNVSMTLQDPRDGALYTALNLGHFGVKLHRSRDDGESWEEVTVPVYPEQTAEEKKREEEKPGKANPWSLVQILSLEAGGNNQPGVLWAGTLPGGLFRSADHGDSWTLIRSLWDLPERLEWFGGGYDEPGIHSICVDPRDSNHVALGVSCGGVWVTRDACETWACQSDGMWAEYMPPERSKEGNIQDPHLLVRCASAPDTLWVQHHNGIFRSTDDCRSWQEFSAEPSVFGFAVAVHPHDPQTAWVIPAVKDECRVPADGKVIVNRTRDGGATFETLRTGLPQEDAYDLVYRHSLDVDATGNRLAMASTTGTLWMTDNQGETWQTLSKHLPPVHSVRFAP